MKVSHFERFAFQRRFLVEAKQIVVDKLNVSNENTKQEHDGCFENHLSEKKLVCFQQTRWYRMSGISSSARAAERQMRRMSLNYDATVVTASLFAQEQAEKMGKTTDDLGRSKQPIATGAIRICFFVF
jgi:hypothetical protein